jgi:hypothetical protein
MTATGNEHDSDIVACGVCYTESPLADMASMTDKNGHAWFIGPECVDALWKLRRPPLTDDTASTGITSSGEGAQYEMAMALPVLIGSMGVFIDILKESDGKIPPYILPLMDQELATAKEAYR